MSQKKSMKYEEAIDRLEQIASLLEEGNLPLDESMSLFEESVKLTAFCKSELEAMKGKITVLENREEEKDNG